MIHDTEQYSIEVKAHADKANAIEDVLDHLADTTANATRRANLQAQLAEALRLFNVTKGSAGGLKLD